LIARSGTISAIAPRYSSCRNGGQSMNVAFMAPPWRDPAPRSSVFES
jgi:hypothetical protein